MRRELWETVFDLVGAVVPGGDAATLVRVTDVALDVPIEVALHGQGAELELRADLPRWRWTTIFDERRGRLRLRCCTTAVSDAVSFDPSVLRGEEL